MNIARASAVAVFLLAIGCTMRDSAETDSARIADSVRAADSANAVDSAAAGVSAVDSSALHAPPPDASGNITGERTKPGGTRGPETSKKTDDMGRDSAFGPIGTIDEKGNVRPIRK